MSEVRCAHFPVCSGCQFIGEPLATQKEKKLSILRDLVRTFSEFNNPLGFLSAGPAFLRDRLDFVWEDGRLGLYSKNLNAISDIELCAQLSPALQSWYTEFRKIRWPVRKGSLRLRVGPQNQRGAWLDFANEDIRSLLAEGESLRALMAMSFVEIGQRRKSLKVVAGKLKLGEPEPRIWFESRFRGETIPLFSYVGSFTQPSLRANEQILARLEEMLGSLHFSVAAEFGAGIGNLSLPLAGRAQHLRVFENDLGSLACFRQTLNQVPALEGLENKIEFMSGDYHRAKTISFSKDELLLVNPPRSGLKGFLDSLRAANPRPAHIIYMSCHPVSWAADAAVLKELGYRLKSADIIDQFPQTAHFEVLSLFHRE